MLSLFVDASSTTEKVECQARRRQTQSNRWSRRGPSPVKKAGIDKSSVRWASLQPGLLRSPCRPRWVWQKPKRKRCQEQDNQPAAGTASGSGDGGRKHEQRISPGKQRGRQCLNVARVCENREMVEVTRSPPKAACSVRGTSPPKRVLSARGSSPPKAVLSVWGTSPLKTVLSARGAIPPKTTPGIGEEGARSPRVRRR